jgi:endoglucanase Acf2
MIDRFAKLLSRLLLVLFGLASCFHAVYCCAEETTTKLGAGGYTTKLPPGAKFPQPEIYQTENVRTPMPTNEWWSSLAWMQYSERQYPHPLAVMENGDGLRIYYPGPYITANESAIFGFLSPDNGKDLTLGHSAVTEFPDARVDGFSDWFVNAAFDDGQQHRLVVSYGHGSPFVYALYEAGSAKITFANPPTIWSGDENDAVLGITVGKSHYGLFGPSGSTWKGLQGKSFTNLAEGKPYFSLAILPEATPETLKRFQQHAYAHVVDSQVDWKYEQTTGMLTTNYTLKTSAFEGENTDTLFALYPHQWRNAPATKSIGSYDSVRGQMKLAAGDSFVTQMPFGGVLPTLPMPQSIDLKLLNQYIDDEAAHIDPNTKDTYWEGKQLGKLATLAGLAEQAENEKANAIFRQEMKRRLEFWFTPTTPDGKPKSAGLFCYDTNWASLIGYPASYGSDTDLNDHHFHYGYFIRAAAEIVRREPAWGSKENFGPMIELLIRDIANPDLDDTLFPRLRNFDPYAGHSWASGNAKFGDGNNNESSSEAMNAWCGLILWGEALGDEAIRDLGIYLYTTEAAAINEYWFDVHGTNHHPDYPASVVTMVWGGKGANGTWFSGNPEAIHGINFLPMQSGSLYLGEFPDYCQQNYDALVAENKGNDWDQWADIIWMYRALQDPEDAAKQFQLARETFVPEAGNSKANTYHWIELLRTFGHVDRSLTADYPLFAVFKREEQRTYFVYNMQRRERTVTFSNGKTVSVAPASFAIARD